MIDELILHASTRSQLEHIAPEAHAILLTGPAGIGKTAIAQTLAAKLLGVNVNKIAGHPFVFSILPTNGTIPIDEIRALQKSVQLKTVGKRPIRRAAIIESAHLLTTEAQNSLLKLLEEPPADTVLILTATSTQSLLPTILSRVQAVTVHPPAKEQIDDLLKRAPGLPSEKTQAYFLSGGLPGLLNALLNRESEHPLLASVAIAKEILQKSSFERLCMLDNLTKQKSTTTMTLEALMRIAEAGLHQAANKNETTRIRQWQRIRKLALQTQESLSTNANPRLALCNLLLQI